MREPIEEVIEQTPHLLRARFPEEGGEYELTCSSSLAQVVGRLGDAVFYFRAKSGWWEFETQDERGHQVPAGDPRQFSREGTFDEGKPGAMGVEWARRILGRCLTSLRGGQERVGE